MHLLFQGRPLLQEDHAALEDLLPLVDHGQHYDQEGPELRADPVDKRNKFPIVTDILSMPNVL